MKRRRFGVGLERKLDFDDEEFLVKLIEEKVIYYGRRYDTVMYINRCVKSIDFLNIVNYRFL